MIQIVAKQMWLFLFHVIHVGAFSPHFVATGIERPNTLLRSQRRILDDVVGSGLASGNGGDIVNGVGSIAGSDTGISSFQSKYKGKRLTPYQILFPHILQLDDDHEKSSAMESVLKTTMDALTLLKDNSPLHRKRMQRLVPPQTQVLKITQNISHPVDPLCWLQAQSQQLSYRAKLESEPYIYFCTAENHAESAVLGAAWQLRESTNSNAYWDFVEELPPDTHLFGGQRFDTNPETPISEEWNAFDTALWVLPAVEVRRLSVIPKQHSTAENRSDFVPGVQQDGAYLPVSTSSIYSVSVHLVRHGGEDDFAAAATRAISVLECLTSDATAAVPVTTLPPIMQRTVEYPRDYGQDMDGQEWYEQGVSRAIENMQSPNATLKKVVLARRLDLKIGSMGATSTNPWNGFDIIKSWKYSSAPPGGHFFYMRPPNSTSEFIGCTPERLFSVATSGKVLSEALAGTRPRGSTPKEDQALGRELFECSKETGENQVVADFIQSTFADLEETGILRKTISQVDSPADSSLQDSKARFLLRRLLHLQHICQIFQGDLDTGSQPSLAIRNLFQRLHPTPALGGFPKEEAMAFIKKHESPGLDRGFYSGPFGMVGKDSADVVVAIRSALVSQCQRQPHSNQLNGQAGYPTSVRLYAGAGIVPGSTVQNEWTETSYKLRVVSSVFPQSPLALQNMPNPNSAWATAFVEEIIRNGVTMFYICPGSRSTPLVAAIARALRRHVGAIHAVSLHDERGAAFRAIGYARATGNPAAVITSSGTAVANLYPAVVEAGMDGVPIILITADRPYEGRHTGANQAIDQVKMFSSSYVRWFRDILPPTGEVPISAALSDAAHAVHSARSMRGPVHMNIQFRENLAPDAGAIRNDNRAGSIISFDGSRFTDAPTFERWVNGGGKFYRSFFEQSYSQTHAAVQEVAHLIRKSSRGIIVVGNIRLSGETDGFNKWLGVYQLISDFADQIGFPIIAGVQASPLRFCSKAVIPFAEHLLRCPLVKDNLSPDLVIQIGAPLVSTDVSSILQQTLYKGSAISHVLIHPTHPNERVDPDYTVSHRIVADPVPFITDTMAMLQESNTRTSSELAYLVKLGRRIGSQMGSIVQRSTKKVLGEFDVDENVMTEPQVMMELAGLLSKEGARATSLFLSNSMPVRDAEAFLYPTSPRRTASLHAVGVNRGASGIDGIVASATGFAEGADLPTVLVIGDVATLHDINSFHGLSGAKSMKEMHAQRMHPLTTVLLNNDGGGIFSFLPVAKHGKDVGFEEFFTTPTNSFSFLKGAEAFGINHSDAESVVSFRGACEDSMSSEDSSIIEAIVAPRNINVAVHREISKEVNSYLGILFKDLSKDIYDSALPIRKYTSDRIESRSDDSDEPSKTLLLLHGWMGDKDDWDTIARNIRATLPDKWSIISVDLPGHGQSQNIVNDDVTIFKQALRLDRPDETRKMTPSIDTIATNVLKSLYRDHGIEKVDAIAGYSLGGRIALAMQRISLTNPIWVMPSLLKEDCKVMLLSAYPGEFTLNKNTSSSELLRLKTETHERARTDDRLVKSMNQAYTRSSVGGQGAVEAALQWSTFVETWYKSGMWGNLTTNEELYPLMASKRIETLARRGNDMGLILQGCSPSRNSRDDWRFCDPARTLFISGEKDTKYTAIGANWQQKEADLLHLVIPGVGHALLIEAAEEICTLVTNFVIAEGPTDAKERSTSLGMAITPGLAEILQSGNDFKLETAKDNIIAAIDSTDFAAFSLAMFDGNRKEAAVFGIGWGENAVPRTLNSLNSRSGFIVQVFSSNGLKVGLGEVAPLNGLHEESYEDVRLQLDEIANALIGGRGVKHISFDSQQILAMDGAMGSYLEQFAKTVGLEQLYPSVKSGLEMALISLASQLVGKPIHRALCDGATSLNGIVNPTSWLLPLNGLIIRGPTGSAVASDSVGSRNYQSLKVKIGHQNLEKDLQAVSLALQMSKSDQGETGKVRGDANRAWSEQDFVTFMRAVDKMDPAAIERFEYIEEPICKQEHWSFEDHITVLEKLHGQTNVAYALDESVADLTAEHKGDFGSIFAELQAAFAVSTRGCAAIVLKPSLIGMELSLQLARACRQYLGIGAVFTSSFDSGVGLAYTAFLASVSDVFPMKDSSMDIPQSYSHGLGTFSLLIDDTLSPSFGSYVNDQGYLNVASISRALFGLKLDEIRDSTNAMPSIPEEYPVQTSVSTASTASRRESVNQTNIVGSTSGIENDSTATVYDEYEASTATSPSGRELSVIASLPLPFSSETACARFTDLPQLPRWSPWISSVAYLDAGRETEWTLKVRGFSFRWRAKSSLLQAPNKGIQWESINGLKNAGIVEFDEIGEASCLMKVRMTVIPPRILASLFQGNSSFFEDFLRNKLMKWSLEMFRDVVKGDLALEQGDVELGDALFGAVEGKANAIEATLSFPLEDGKRIP